MSFATMLLSALVVTSSACLWDRDTLAAEAAGRMDYVSVLVGRFERNPPLYFQMRIDRETAELAKNPALWYDYDDIAVAESRLGKNDLALKWIAQKRAELEKRNIKDKDAWYRFYANEGTFYTVRWMTSPTGKQQDSDLKQAAKDLDKAIEINPDAHFGREWVQRDFVNWALDGSAPSFSEALFVVESPPKPEKVALGLAGLMRLGAAWESPDITAALGAALAKFQGPKGAQIASLALYRTEELIKGGSKPISQDPKITDRSHFFGFGGRPASFSPDGWMDSFNRTQYKRLRAEADEWQRLRTEFMLAKLQTGHHPDTDPDFWVGYKEHPAPTIQTPAVWDYPGFWSNFWSQVEFCSIVLAACVVGWFYLFVLRRPKKSVAESAGKQ